MREKKKRLTFTLFVPEEFVRQYKIFCNLLKQDEELKKLSNDRRIVHNPNKLKSLRVRLWIKSYNDKMLENIKKINEQILPEAK